MGELTDLRALQESDRKYHLHPFTNHEELHALGTHVIESGEGVWVIDAHGRKLLDGLAGLWCVNVGYGRREIVDAVARQLERLSFYPSFFNTSTEPTIRLAERLARIAPTGLSHTLFCNSGSEANETALKIIRAYNHLRGRPKKAKILTRTFAYHGVTLATTSMTGLESCQMPFDLPLAGFLHAPAPYSYHADKADDPEAYGRWCVEETARLIENEGAETIAAMFIEPIQGAGGVIVPPPGYLAAMRELARRNDILFVADEVITAFGRLGCWFASELWNLQPDLLVLAKGITSGYIPLGAVMVSDHLAEALIHGGTFAHGFTYTGHPAAAAAAAANIEIIERDGLIPRVREDVGPYFQAKLRGLAEHPSVGEVRGEALIGALELVPRGGRRSTQPGGNLGIFAAKLAREEGVIVRGIRDIMAIAPPLIVTREEIDFLFASVGRTLNRFGELA